MRNNDEPEKENEQAVTGGLAPPELGQQAVADRLAPTAPDELAQDAAGAINCASGKPASIARRNKEKHA